MNTIDYTKLPVYEQKQFILDSLRENQVIVVQSPTGSGKTTQIPVILYEANYAQSGIIAVTQPRRIAALSVSEFIAKQLKTDFPGLVGYKMRFEDKTNAATKIKIMTDGILLQEMKLDPMLSKYSVVMVDEAHERSLNIDFVLGLLKRVLRQRKDFRIVVSSATINAEAFSQYFDDCPVVTIDTITFPVKIIYDPLASKITSATPEGSEQILSKIESIIAAIFNEETQVPSAKGDILIFLPGEKIIKDCVRKLAFSSFSAKIHIVPLYGRLPKEEQEKVFLPSPQGRKKVVISTNIAETSVTINGITTVIDSGLAKMNFYDPTTYTSSLNEVPVSKAGCDQRKGRAGRTCAGTCYRLYSKRDFESRELFTTEEIFRTDLSEVLLRMAELDITDFEGFDFISKPDAQSISGALETLNLLRALDQDRHLSSIGKLMAQFPLEPRVSRILVESILKYPDVLEQIIIAASFLSAQSPFVLPPGEEMDARKAHHNFRDAQGDFVSYVKLFYQYQSIKSQKSREQFCQSNYLDERVMAEIENIKTQLEEDISSLGIPISEKKAGSFATEDYLCCIAAGMLQFVCVRKGRETYCSLTAEHISIHPGSGMFRCDPLFIVAGEIVRTSRIFASSVSPLTKNLLKKIDPSLEEKLMQVRSEDHRENKNRLLSRADESAKTDPRNQSRKDRRLKNARSASKSGQIAGLSDSGASGENTILIGEMQFEIRKIKGKKTVILPLERFSAALKRESDNGALSQAGQMRGTLLIRDTEVMAGEKIETIRKAVKKLGITFIEEKAWPKGFNGKAGRESTNNKLAAATDFVMKVVRLRPRSKTGGFIALYTDNNGTYWLKTCKNFTTALSESLSSLETLADQDITTFTPEQKQKINTLYRTLNSLYE